MAFSFFLKLIVIVQIEPLVHHQTFNWERNSHRTVISRLYNNIFVLRMSQIFFASLRISLSDQRLDAYRQSTTDTDIDLLERYFWNIAICEALYPPLQNLEISLRNNINHAITISFENPHWLTDYKLLDPSKQKHILGVIEKAKKAGKTINTGQLIAELNFGFWTSLFDAKYDRVFWQRKTLIRSAFPNMPTHIRNRSTLSKRFTDIRILRNLVFHHKPIWDKEKLTQQHENIVEALDWLNPDVKVMNQMICDRFPTIYQQGSQPYREKLLNLASNLS